MGAVRVYAGACVHGLAPSLGILDQGLIKGPVTTAPGLDRLNGASHALFKEEAKTVLSTPYIHDAVSFHTAIP
jgi:hypothetical protein